MRTNKKKAMINTRSHNIFSVDTDHRLVTLTMFSENDWGRGKKEIKDKRDPEDEILKELPTGEKFETNIGVPQGDSLSLRLFTIYLDEALKELDGEIERNDH